MIFTLVHEVSYDTTDTDLRNEYYEWVDDNEMTLEGFKEFLIDRFISPNFDKGQTTIKVALNNKEENNETV